MNTSNPDGRAAPDTRTIERLQRQVEKLRESLGEALSLANTPERNQDDVWFSELDRLQNIFLRR